MSVINLSINVFYKLFSKHKEKGLMFSIWLLTLAVVFNFFSLLHVLLYYMSLSRSYDVMVSAFLLLPAFYGVSHYLEKKFIKEGLFTERKMPAIVYLIAPCYLLASIVAFPISFRYLSL